MAAVLHPALPDDMRALRPLPGVQPVVGPWLRVDDAYGAQMAERVRLLDTQADDVIWQAPEAQAAAEELLEMLLLDLPQFGFEVSTSGIACPDGRRVSRSDLPALEVLGRVLQCDLCLLEKVGDEHVLAGAVLCFPASWRLSDKVGRPLEAIHAPVAVYDTALATRVQRLFDGVQAGRPLWRFNQLWYEDPDLFQPRSETEPRPLGDRPSPYLRAERQTILRLPMTRWCVFAIHTYVVRASDLPDEITWSPDQAEALHG